MTGLTPNVISYNFRDGLDTKTAPTLVLEKNLLTLENGRFIEGANGSIQKRNGYNAVSTGVLGSLMALTGLSAITTFNSELDVVATNNFYSFSPNTNKWIFKNGLTPAVQPTTRALVKNANNALNSDSAIINNSLGNPIGVYAWEDSRGSVWCQVIDEATGTVLLGQTQLGTGLSTPRVVVVNTNIEIFTSGTGGGIYKYEVNPNTPANDPNGTLLILGGWDQAYFEVVPFSNTSITVLGLISGNLVIKNYSVPGWAVATTQSTGILCTGLAACALGTLIAVTYWYTGVANQATVAFYTQSTLVLSHSYTQSFSGAFTGLPALADIIPLNGSTIKVRTLYQVPILNTVSTNVVNIHSNGVSLPQSTIYITTANGLPIGGGTVSITSSNGPQNVVYTGVTYIPASSTWSITGCSGGTGTLSTGANVVYNTVSSNVLVQNIATNGTGLGTETVMLRGVGLASRQFLWNSHTYCLVTFTSNTQQTLFLCDNNSAICGKFLDLVAGPLSSNGRLPGVNSTASGVFEIPVQLQTVTENVASPQAVQPALTYQPIEVIGIEELSLNFNTSISTKSQLGLNLQLATGSMIKAYDGLLVTELGFNNYPEPLTITQLQSQIGVTTITKASGTPTTRVWITIPKNWNVNPLTGTVASDGTLIQAGEYLMIGGFYNDGSVLQTGTVAWFSVDGSGSAPGLGGVWTNQVKVAINSSDSCQEIAAKLYAALAGASLSTQYTVVAPGTSSIALNQVALDQATSKTSMFSQVVMNRQFGIAQTYTGNASGGGQSPICAVSFTPGNLIQGGQYFTFQTSIGITTTSILQGYVVWFQVDGVGSPPLNVPGTSNIAQIYYIQVNINSTDTGSQVATKVATACGLNPNLTVISTNGPLVALGGAATGVLMTDATMATWQPCSPGTMSNGFLGSGSNLITPGGGLVQGDFDFYTYNSLYEWIDNQGQLHRSAPSVNTTIAIPKYGPVGVISQASQLTVGTPQTPTYANIGVTKIVAPTLRLTNKPNVDIAIYRSLGNGSASALWRVSSPINLLFSSVLVDTVSTNDYIPDNVLTALELEYTDGGVVENDGSPATNFITNFQDRLWAISSEDPYLLYYSKEFVSGTGVAFSAQQTIRVDSSGGEIVAVQGMDNSLIIFCETKIWALQGFGPDAAGNGSFNGPLLITSNTGCRDPGSVVLFNDGIIFKSLRGFWLLDRSTQISYIGIAVEAFNSDVVIAATSIPGTQEIRFLSETGTTLLYDYLLKQWSSFTNHQGVDAVNYNNTYYYLPVIGTKVLYENPGYYGDDGVSYGLKVGTAWFKLGAIASFKRLWEVIFKGSFTGLNPIKIDVYENYDASSPVETWYYNASAGASGGVWGSDALWGQSTPWGGAPGTPQPPSLMFRMKLKNQKAASFMFVISETPNIPTGSAFSLDGLDLVIGMKVGGFKLPGANTIG